MPKKRHFDEDTDIEHLDLRYGLYSLLKRNSVRTVGELEMLTRDDILQLPHATEKIVDELEEALGEQDVFLYARIPDDTPIDELDGLILMWRNALRNAGVLTVSDAQRHTKYTISAIPNFGLKGQRVLIRELKRYGRQLKEPRPWR